MAALFLSLIIIIMLEVPRLVREKLWRELAAFSFILTAAYALAFLKIMEVF